MKSRSAIKKPVKAQNRSSPGKTKKTSGQKDGSECVVFCKRVAPNVYNIQDGVAVLSGHEDCSHDGVCMTAKLKKVVFVVGQDQGE